MVLVPEGMWLVGFIMGFVSCDTFKLGCHGAVVFSMIEPAHQSSNPRPDTHIFLDLFQASR